MQGWLHDLIGGYASSDFALLVIVWVILLACLLVLTPMVRSPWGRVLRAIREDEDAAAALGKPVYWYKLQSLAIGAGFGAIAGLLYAFEFQNFGPDDFDPLDHLLRLADRAHRGRRAHLGGAGRSADLRLRSSPVPTSSTSSRSPTSTRPSSPTSR